LDKQATLTFTTTKTADITIGGYSPSSYLFNGLIDEVRIYNRALSDDEIKALYQAKAKLNYDDIAFADSDKVTFLNYWKEADGKFWVKVPSIPPGKKTIYVYYGNLRATSRSNGDNTFDFFDDFNDGVIDSNKWQVDSGTLSETATPPGYLYENSATQLNIAVSKNYIFTDGVIEVRTSGTVTGGNTDPDNDNAIIWRYQDTNNFYFVHYDFANPGGGALCNPPCDAVQSRKRQDGTYSGGVFIANPELTEAGNWYKFIIKVHGDQFDIWYEKTRGTYSWADATWTSGKIGLGSFHNEEEARFDYIFIRKYTSPEPTISVGNEQSI
jgi:hypothetical protein